MSEHGVTLLKTLLAPDKLTLKKESAYIIRDLTADFLCWTFFCFLKVYRENTALFTEHQFLLPVEIILEGVMF